MTIIRSTMPDSCSITPTVQFLNDAKSPISIALPPSESTNVNPFCLSLLTTVFKLPSIGTPLNVICPVCAVAVSPASNINVNISFFIFVCILLYKISVNIPFLILDSGAGTTSGDDKLRNHSRCRVNFPLLTQSPCIKLPAFYQENKSVSSIFVYNLSSFYVIFSFSNSLQRNAFLFY